MINEFNKDEQNLISRLRGLKPSIKPTESSFERMLSSLKTKAVTNDDGYRYSFSMWKYITAAALVLIVVGGVIFYKHGSLNPTTAPSGASYTQQKVTTSNVDATLDQTDQDIQNTMNQVEQDLQNMDQSGSEDDVNNI